MGRPVTAAPPTPADSAPRGRSAPGAAGARAGGAGALARARRVRGVAAPARGRRALGLLRGPAHRQRPARLPPRALARVQGHLPALSDDARLPAWSARAAGTATGCPSRSPSNRSSASPPRRRSRSTGSSASTQRAAASVFAYLEEWNRLTERIGFWLDLEDAYRTLDESYIESVWWALSQIDARGLLYEGHKVVPYCPRCETTLSSHEVALGYGDVVDAERVPEAPAWRAARSGCSCGRPRRGRCPGNVAVAVAPAATYARARAGDEMFVLAEDRVEAVLGEDAGGPRALHAASSCVERYGSYRGPDLRRHRPRARAAADPRRRVRDDRGRHRHRAPGAGLRRGRLPRGRRGRQVPSDADEPRTLYNPVGPDGTYDERVREPRRAARYEGRFVKDPALTARADRGPRRARAAAAGGGLRALLPALLALRTRRCSTTPNRPGTSPPRGCARSCWRPTRPSTGTRRTSSTGASATGWPTTSTGRSRASATGARRCRCGAASGGTST